MTDAVRRQILKGISPRLAIQASIDRMFLPLLTSTLTTVLAFLPLATFPGPTGEFVGGIGKSVIAALSSSFVISLTAIATLAALLLAKVARRATESGRTGFWVSGIDAGPLKRAFQTSLMTSLRAPLVSILCAVVLPTCGFIGLSTLPLSFFPPADRNQINLEIRLSSPSSVARTRAVVDQADAYLRSQPEVVSASWFVGNSAPSFYYNIIQDEDGNANFAQAMVTTTNLDVIGGLVDRINAELSHSIPHSQVIASQLTQGPPTTAPIELRISGPDRDELRRIGEAARLVLSGIAAVHATSASDAGGEPKIWFDLDEDRAAQAGLSATAIARKIGESLNGTTGGSVIEGNLDLPVRLRPVPVSNTNFQTLSDMSLLENGERVPLAALGNFQLRPSAPSLRRLDGRPVNIVLAYLDTNSLPGPVIDAFNATWAASNFTLPPGCTLSFGGESEARADSVGSLVGQIGMIAVLTIALIVLTFRSFRLAAVVLVVAVLSAGLGFLSLTVFGYSFGFMAIIAIVGLIGVAINGAIIILSGLRGSEQAMSGDKKAITEEVMATSRHIWSTTLTTFGGFVPLMLSDSLFWPPFAVTIAGGILLSTTVNFYFVPQTFLIFRQIDRSRSIQAGPDSAEQVLT
ncbi:MAG: efflux RND transporter permease subunit [Pseudomonadota bacterium]